MKKTLATAFLLLMAASVFAQISMEKTDSGFLIKDGENPVLFYQSEPKSENGKYERLNYIHPLWGIDGNILTEDFPTDHPYHRGIFWAWHQLWVGDKMVADSWELKNFSQEILEIEYYLDKERNGVFSTEVAWKSPRYNVNGMEKPYVRENSRIKVYQNLGKYRRIDFEIRLTALEKDVKIGGSGEGKEYGGFSARLLLPSNVSFQSPQGNIQPIDHAMDEGGWMNISGAYGKRGKKGGVIIISNPQNPGYPEPWNLGSKESAQNAAYPGKEPIALPVGKPLVLKYTMVVYKGDFSHNRIMNLVSAVK